MATTGVSGVQGTSGQQDPTGNSAFTKLQVSDFINLMVTGLTHQDPTNPTDTGQLMQQVSQIGSIESTQSLSTTLQSVALGQSVATAGNLIGRNITGKDANGTSVTGNVDSVSVSDGNTTLNVGTSSVPLSNVTQIQTAASASTTTGS